MPTLDNVGNTQTDASGRQFIYDGENKQTEVKDSQNNTIGKYFYDGDGKRVKKIVGSEITIFVYNAGGQLVAEYSTQTNPTPQIGYLTADHLGSPRINTDAGGQVIARHDYMPFGEEITSTQTAQRSVGLSYAGDGVRQQFTLYERDNETELDFAQARMFKSVFGRYNSPDPLMTSARRSNPQTFNRYIYVLNNPLIFVDPLGLEYRQNDKTGNIAWYGKDDDRAGSTEFTDDYYKDAAGSWVHLNQNGPNPNADSNDMFAYAGWNYVDASSVPGFYNSANLPSMQVGEPDNTSWDDLLEEYITGNGPRERQFGPTSDMTQNMRTSPVY